MAVLRNGITSTMLLALLAFGFPAWNSANAGTTYYVRTDGGDANQCTGLSDTPYPGSGTGHACAWMHPFHAMPPGGGPRIAGGDTLIIGSGSYMMGQGAPGADYCFASTCYMPPIPSGPDARTRTRILGNPGVAPPRLWGTGGAGKILNLEGSSNVEIGFLEVTDQDDCVYKHSNASANCPSAGTGTWAKTGLSANASSSVWLHDLNIHGLAAHGMNVGGLTDWTVERVKMIANGRAGWEGNLGTNGNSSNSGQIILRNMEVAWNGCGEHVATGEPWACWALQGGGYGDGLGTADTGGQWLIEDAFFHHNTSDGLDLRFMDGADTSHVTLRRVHAAANAGNQVKVKGNSLIENSVMVGHCIFFKGRDFMIDGDFCRAYGSTLVLVMTGNDTAVVRHNTLAGEGDVQIAYVEGNTSDTIYIQNNAVVGFPYYKSPGSLTGFSGGSAPAAKSFSGNLAWNIASCPSGTTCDRNPKLTNMALATFDAEPLSDSPVIDKAPMINEVTTDFLMGKRPIGDANDIGAYEFGSADTLPRTGGPLPPIAEPPPTLPGESTPVCVAAAPTVTMAGPTAAVAAGTANAYTVSVRNNDSSACGATRFSLAQALPGGWTGALAATTLDLAPGTSAGTTSRVTSPSDATEGDYGLGIGVSNGIQTAKASATFAIAARVLACGKCEDPGRESID